ncbi:MAG: hypothetical protein AAF721_15285 [Myxococcota bacterium]
MGNLVALAALGSLTVACSSDGAPEENTPRGALLFGLDDDDVAELHARYVSEEALEQLTARLTAPFDCSLFDDLCGQVGRAQAIQITGELVDYGLQGIDDEALETYITQRLDEAMDLHDAEPQEDDEATGFRASHPWTFDTSGRYRLAVRNGITTPVIGSRRAWTEAKTQRRSGAGVWSNKKATEICVDAGTNTQTVRTCDGADCETDLIESPNPSETCVTSKKSHNVQTYHSRVDTGEFPGGFSTSATLRARGEASGEINGRNLDVDPATFTRFYF